MQLRYRNVKLNNSVSNSLKFTVNFDSEFICSDFQIRIYCVLYCLNCVFVLFRLCILFVLSVLV